MSKALHRPYRSRFKHYPKDAVFHLYNHGVGKQDVFLEENDYRHYLNKLAESLKKHNISLIAYVLMPNHIHLVVRQDTATPVYKLISSLHTSYSMYFNRKYNRKGHLFQDRFKQVILDSDEQLVYLSKYVHLNPVKAGLVQEPWKYFWSSCQDYLGNNPLSLCVKDILISSMMAITNIDKADFTREYVQFCIAASSEKENELEEDFAIELN